MSADSSPPLYRATRRRALRNEGAWDTTVAALLRAGYCFLPLQFSAEGHIFRGLRNGLEKTLLSGRAGHFSAQHSMARLEEKLGIFFVSNLVGDALGVARLEHGGADAAVVVFPSQVFNQALARGQAGVLAFAEGGLVFRYPFLCRAPALDEASCLLVDSAAKSRIHTDPRLRAQEETLQRKGIDVIALDSPRSGSAIARATGGHRGMPTDIVAATFTSSVLRPSAAP